MARSVLQFTATGLVVTVALAVLTAFLAQRAGEQEAVRSAERVARVVAGGVVAPRVTPQLAAGDPAAQADLAAAVRAVMATGPVVRVKVWGEGDRLLWSDEPRLVGQLVPLDDEGHEALEGQTAVSGITDLTKPENRYERGQGKLLEVYVGVRDTSGTPRAIEVYQRYDAVAEAAGQAWRSFAPAGLGALLLLEMVQVPFAWRLARRIRRHEQAEAELLKAAVDASQAERRRIAHDVHDGVVQDLTGLTYDLDAARLAGTPGEGGDPALVARTASGLRRCVAELRRLLVDLSPPPLPAAGLTAALQVLAESLERNGKDVAVHLDADPEPTGPAASLLYRCALEAVRNVSAHSGARRVGIDLVRDRNSATLVVADDGVGIDEVRRAQRTATGHLGLRALEDLLAESGGSLTTSSVPGGGTTLVATVPLDPLPARPGAALAEVAP